MSIIHARNSCVVAPNNYSSTDTCKAECCVVSERTGYSHSRFLSTNWGGHYWPLGLVHREMHEPGHTAVWQNDKVRIGVHGQHGLEPNDVRPEPCKRMVSTHGAVGKVWNVIYRVKCIITLSWLYCDYNNYHHQSMSHAHTHTHAHTLTHTHTYSMPFGLVNALWTCECPLDTLASSMIVILALIIFNLHMCCCWLHRRSAMDNFT